MQSPKFSLEFQERAWFEIIAQTLRPLGLKVFLSFQDPSQTVSLPQQWVDDVIYDHYPGEGPLGAWVTLAERFSDEDFISVPVDMPLVKAEDLQHLCSQSQSGYLLAEDPHFLLATLKSKDFLSLKAWFQEGGRRAEGFWDYLGAQGVPVSPSEHLQNFNCPEDLQRLFTK